MFIFSAKMRIDAPNPKRKQRFMCVVCWVFSRRLSRRPRWEPGILKTTVHFGPMTWRTRALAAPFPFPTSFDYISLAPDSQLSACPVRRRKNCLDFLPTLILWAFCYICGCCCYWCHFVRMWGNEILGKLKNTMAFVCLHCCVVVLG